MRVGDSFRLKYQQAGSKTGRAAPERRATGPLPARPRLVSLSTKPEAAHLEAEAAPDLDRRHDPAGRRR